MNQTAAVWLLIMVAALLANLPFINERLLGVFALRSVPIKSFFVRLIELLLLYAMIGLVGWAIESSLGNVFKQKWQFYVTTLTLFFVMGFPGFVYRYLLRKNIDKTAVLE